MLIVVAEQRLYVLAGIGFANSNQHVVDTEVFPLVYDNIPEPLDVFLTTFIEYDI